MMTQEERIDLIIDKAAKYFGTTREDFTKIYRQHGKCPFSFERSLITHHLYTTTSLTLNDISIKLGYAGHPTILNQMRRVRDELSDSIPGYEKTKRCYRDLISYIEEGQ